MPKHAFMDTFTDNENAKVDAIRAYDQNCIGCQETKTHTMISFAFKNSPVYDIFLTKGQAEAFVHELAVAVFGEPVSIEFLINQKETKKEE